MHILLGCLVGTSCFRLFIFIFSSSHKFVRFLTLGSEILQKRLLSTEGSPWRPSSFSKASIASRDGGRARICHLASGNSSGTYDSLFLQETTISPHYFLGNFSRFRYSHISLCLFYSSLLKFLLLVILSIWGPQVPRDKPPPAYVYKVPSESPLWHLLDDDVLDRTWLVRNLLGGMSAGFGLRGTSSSSCYVLW